LNLVERIWRPTDKDLVGGIRQQRYVQLLTLGPTAAVTVGGGSSIVGPDTIRWLTNICVIATAGAAQFAEAWIGSIAGPGAAIASCYFGASFVRVPVATAVASSMEYDGIALLPGEYFQVNTNFNAGVAGNSVLVGLYGWEIPRANII
jgi:hypothetical protein